jgi:TatA/E family protein of Tat protein translocase
VAGLGAPELIIILIIVMLLFGGAKLPKLARSLGESSKEFRKGLSEGASAGESKPESKANPARIRGRLSDAAEGRRELPGSRQRSSR